MTTPKKQSGSAAKNAGQVAILWDASQLWGLLALATLSALGTACDLVPASYIAHGGLRRKQPALLLVPGGSARQKALALGKNGIRAIRDWVGKGGIYLGICGGAGLGLSHAHGLGLCPWQRQILPDRQAHLLSGPVLAKTDSGLLELPVWWPGRFEPGKPGPRIIATYERPARELWIGDSKIRDENADLPEFPYGQPLVIAGEFGKGRYVLSYAHPETPGADAANAWLGELLANFGIGSVAACQKETLPAAEIEVQAEIAAALAKMRELVRTGGILGYFFPRESWLFGWKQGMPGMACNNLLACIDYLASQDLTSSPVWQQKRLQFVTLLETFLALAQMFLKSEAARNLAYLPQASQQSAIAFRDAIFGHPMLGGGKAGELLALLSELIIACQEKGRP